MMQQFFSAGLTTVNLVFTASKFIVFNSISATVATTKLVYHYGGISLVNMLGSFFAYQSVHGVIEFAKKHAHETYGDDGKPIYSSYAVPSDISTAVYYTNLYSYTMPAQEKFFSGINWVLGVSEGDQKFALMKSSANKILVGELFALSTAIFDAAFSNEEFTADEAYKLLKPIVKHGSTLGCKYYIDPTNMFDLFGDKGQLMATSAVCNMFGELVEGVTRLGYTAAFAAKTDYYTADEVLSDLAFSIYKTFHQKGEKYSGKFLTFMAELLDGQEGGIFASSLANFPVHFYVGGFVRKIASKTWSIGSKKLLEGFYNSNKSSDTTEAKHVNDSPEQVGHNDVYLITSEDNSENRDWQFAVEVDYNCIVHGDCEAFTAPKRTSQSSQDTESYVNSSADGCYVSDFQYHPCPPSSPEVSGALFTASA